MSECERCKKLEAQRDTALDAMARVNEELRALKLHIETYVIGRIDRFFGGKG